MIRAILAVLLLALFSPMATHAQYAGSAADTLRYSEVTHGTVDMVTPGGTLTVRSRHEGLIGLTFPSRGRVHAWYDSLLIDSQGPAGASRPNTSALLGQRFEFQLAPTGHVMGVHAPAMPSEVAEVTDLTRQFDDFFITVPPGGLVIGAAWQDTVVNDKAGRDKDKTTSRHIRSYVVERDTSVSGVRAFIIRVDQQVEIATSSEIPKQNMTVSAKLSGTDSGWAIFAPSIGRLLERRRSGSLKGEMHMQPGGVAEATVIPQSYSYESRIELRP